MIVVFWLPADRPRKPMGIATATTTTTKAMTSSNHMATVYRARDRSKLSPVAETSDRSARTSAQRTLGAEWT